MTPPRHWSFRRLSPEGLWGVIAGRAIWDTGVLSLHDSGLWNIELQGRTQHLRLNHAWPAFAWITLRFDDNAMTAPSGTIELTIWKHSMTPAAWSDLRRCIAGQLAMPMRVPVKGIP